MALFDVFKKGKERERFRRKQKDKEEMKTEAKKPEALNKASVFVPKKTGQASKIIFKPHITEKTAGRNEQGMYVFKIAPDANKTMARRAIKETYGVAPQKVNIIKIPSRTRFVRGKYGTKQGFKKAVVYLKKGDKIDLS